MLIGLRVALVTLIVLATGAFVVGVALERGAEDSHQEASKATHAESTESGAAHKETGEGEAAQKETGEAVHSGEGETGPARATEESSGGESDATLLGVNLESIPLVILVALASLALAAAVWLRPHLGLLLGLVAAAMLVFAAVDVRELTHQLDESREGLALLVAVVAALHLAAAAVAALALGGGSGQAVSGGS